MNQSDKACDFCRKRKFKCTREIPQCTKCIQYSENCNYSPRKRRSTLTKSHFHRLQNRIRILEKALSTVVKSDDEIKLLIETLSNDKSLQDGNKNDEGNEVEILKNDMKSRRAMNIKPNEETIVSDDDSLLNEDFTGVEHLYWHENDSNSDNDLNEVTNNSTCPDNLSEKPFITPKGLIDGMGALSVDIEHKNTTYYGIFSSNGVLKILRKLDKQNNDNATNFSNYNLKSSIYNQNNINLMNSKYSETLLNNNDFRMDLIASYFETYHTVYPLIQKDSFIKKYESFKLRSKEDISSIKDISFQILIDTILAIGAFCKLGESSIIDLLYYRRVKIGLQRIDLMECACYHLLEACTLLGNYIQKRNKPNTGGNYFGLSFRMAISFGLHKEMNLNHNNSSSLEFNLMVERRRRLWWTLYLFDVGHSITFGRPIHLPKQESINIRFPLNIDDSDIERLKEDFTGETYPTIYAGLTEEVKLSVIFYRVYSCLTNLSKANLEICDRISEIIDLNSLIERFIYSLPQYFNEDDKIVERALNENCPPEWFRIKIDGAASIPKWFEFRRKKLIWKYKNLQILMFRNFIWETSNVFKNDADIKKYEQGSNTKDLIDSSIRFCSKAAHETIYSISCFVSLCELDTLSSWYATYYIFQAVLISILLLYKDIRCKSSQNIDMWLEEIEITKASLNKLEKYNSLASNLIDKINILTIPIIEILKRNNSQQSEADLMNSNTEEIFVFDFNNLPSTAATLFSNVGIDFEATEGMVMSNMNSNNLEDIFTENTNTIMQWDQERISGVEENPFWG